MTVRSETGAVQCLTVFRLETAFHGKGKLHGSQIIGVRERRSDIEMDNIANVGSGR